MFYKEDIAVYFDKYTEPIYKLCKENVEFFSVKADYIYGHVSGVPRLIMTGSALNDYIY
jgi:hypothetical protein